MTDWLSASAMLLAGLIVGAMFLYGMKRRRVNVDAERADLEAKRDALLARLREDPNDKQLELQAAEVLKKLDGLKPSVPSTPSVVTQPQSNEALKGFLWGAASVAVLAAIGFFVWQSAKPKETPTQQAPMQSAAKDGELTQLQQRVSANPDDLNLRDDLAIFVFPVGHYVRAISTRRLELHARRVLRHHDQRPDAEQLAGQRDGLRVVARRKCEYPALALVRGEL